MLSKSGNLWGPLNEFQDEKRRPDLFTDFKSYHLHKHSSSVLLFYKTFRDFPYTARQRQHLVDHQAVSKTFRSRYLTCKDLPRLMLREPGEKAKLFAMSSLQPNFLLICPSKLPQLLTKYLDAKFW